jgi:Predicted transcriptional regulator
MSKMGNEIFESLNEALEHAKGNIELKSTRMTITPVCDSISAEEIKAVRKTLGMTQLSFAILIGVSKKTVESWEVGRYAPDGAARRLISILQKDPTLPKRYDIIA